MTGLTKFSDRMHDTHYLCNYIILYRDFKIKKKIKYRYAGKNDIYVQIAGNNAQTSSVFYEIFRKTDPIISWM